MNVSKMPIKAQLVSVARTAPTAPFGVEKPNPIVYSKGDPVFDAYQQECTEFRERARLMIQQENGLPKNFLGGGSEGSNFSALQLHNQVRDAFKGFYRGSVNGAALEQVLSDVVADLRSSYINKGYDPTEFMPQLIEDVYAEARLNCVAGAGVASWRDGLPLAAEQNGHDRDTKDWIYYDSDYYYRVEETKEKLLEMTYRIAKKYDVDMSRLSLPVSYEDGDLRKSIYESYNSYINFYAREQRHIGNIIDETVLPPKGFRFFYKDNSSGTNLWTPNLPAPRDEPEAAFDGVLQVWYGDWSFTGRVPVRKNVFEFPTSVNMFDVVSYGSQAPLPDEITGFLRNVDFFDWCASNYYTNSHPRRN